MKLSTVAFLLAATASSSDAFTPNVPRSSFISTIGTHRRGGVLDMSAAQEEIDQLLARAAKAREEAAQLSKELGKDEDISVEAATIAKESVSMEELLSLTSSIDFERGDPASQNDKLDSMVASGDLQMWKSAAAFRDFPVSLSFLEMRTGGQITSEALGIGGEDDVTMDDFKYALGGVTLGSTLLGVGALAFLPENVGATVCYAMALIPITMVAIGSSAPGIIAGAIASFKGKGDSDGDKLERICLHEAGHFMCGYLCGLPIKGYSSLDSGTPCVEFHQTQEGPVTGREFSKDEINALAVVSMSGSIAEIIGLGEAKGGDNDLYELEACMRRSEEFIGAQKQQDLTRWGAFTAYNLLNENKEKYDALVEAFKEQKSVPECVAILESR